MLLRGVKGEWMTLKVLIGIFFVIIFVLMIFPMFNELLAFFGGGEDGDTVASFNELIMNIEGLDSVVGEKGCVSEMVYYYVGEDYALTGFGKGDEGIKDACNDHVRPKPFDCGEFACLCLYNTDDWDDTPDNVNEASLGLLNNRCRILLDFDEVNGFSDDSEPGNLGGSKVGEIGVLGWAGSYADLLFIGGAEESCSTGLGFDWSDVPNWGGQVVYVEVYKNEKGKSLFISRFDPNDSVYNVIKDREKECSFV